MSENRYHMFMKKVISNHPMNSNRSVLPLHVIKQGVRLIAKRYGINKVYLFGSYAYGNPNRFSDLDLMIDYGTCDGLDCIGFIDELEQYFRKDIDAVNINHLSEILKDEIGERKILIYDKLWVHQTH